MKVSYLFVPESVQPCFPASNVDLSPKAVPYAILAAPAAMSVVVLKALDATSDVDLTASVIVPALTCCAVDVFPDPGVH